MTDRFEQAAWSWVDHVRSGGSTPWLSWAQQEPGAVAGVPSPADALPGAAELELVRRLAARAPATLAPQAFTRLADLVLARSGPGRGLAQLPLLWPADPVTARVGAPPTDPARVPAGELVRVGVGTLADLLLRATPTVRPPRRAFRRPWSPAFRLAGAPVTADAVRASLRASGHIEGGRRPDVLLFVEPFDVLLGQIWTARVQRGQPVRWATFVGRWARRRELPLGARLDSVARSWASRVGPDKVHVLVAPCDPSGAARRTASEVLGLRTADAAGQRALRDLSPAATDLLRRLNRVLGVRVAPDRQRSVLREAAALLESDTGDPLAIPERHLAWAEDAAERLGEALGSGGYAVHGDLDGIAVRRRAGAIQPRSWDVLELVLGACLTLAEPARRRGQEAR